MAGTRAPITLFNRYSGRVETEPVFGERWLRWTYETAGGRLALALFARRAWFSRVFGWRMNRPASARLIAPFVRDYGIDSSEFVESVDSYPTFNAFFYRRLKDSVRPIATDAGIVTFPADGRHLGFADVAGTRQFYAKGQCFDLRRLLADDFLAGRFEQGSMVISRLCPVDYHRFHFPISGVAAPPRLIHGPLFSVNPIALRRTLDHLLENKRMITVIETSRAGTVVLVEIGATCVGSIIQTSVPGPVVKGGEKGYFAFGGSCVITLFEPDRVRLDADLLEHSRDGRELYARFGDRMGQVMPTPVESAAAS